MQRPVTKIYSSSNYRKVRQIQSHFSEDSASSIKYFADQLGSVSRCISSYFFEIDNYHGYTMYLPTLYKKENINVYCSIGEWNWNRYNNKWEFFWNKENTKDGDLDDFIKEGTEKLNNGECIPDRDGW
jgi:hypothetical protein